MLSGGCREESVGGCHFTGRCCSSAQRLRVPEFGYLFSSGILFPFCLNFLPNSVKYSQASRFLRILEWQSAHFFPVSFVNLPEASALWTKTRTIAIAKIKLESTLITRRCGWKHSLDDPRKPQFGAGRRRRWCGLRCGCFGVWLTIRRGLIGQDSQDTSQTAISWQAKTKPYSPPWVRLASFKPPCAGGCQGRRKLQGSFVTAESADQAPAASLAGCNCNTAPQRGSCRSLQTPEPGSLRRRSCIRSGHTSL